MINNIIQLGKHVDEIPFAETVEEGQDVIEMKVGSREADDLFLDSAKVVQATNKKLYHVSPTKAINRGKNQHFYLHDFSLSKSFIVEGDNGKKIAGINRDKINTNYKNTEGFQEKLDLDEQLENFLKDFYQFVLKNDSQFIVDVFYHTADYLESLTKTEFGNLLFAFALSKAVVDKYELKVGVEQEYYYLGELIDLQDMIKELVTSETLEDAPVAAHCSFCNSSEKAFAPYSATFYYSFAKNPENVFYDLNNNNPDKHLLICKECYGNYNVGKKFMENYLKSNLLGSKYFSIFEIDDGNLSSEIAESLDVLRGKKDTTSVYTNKSLRDLREALESNQGVFMDLGIIGDRGNLGITMFFYEYDNGYRVIKTIHDIYPSKILSLLRENDCLIDFSFDVFMNEFFRDQANNSYDLLVKQKLNLLEKMLLDIPINYDSLLERFINKASYKLRNGQKAGLFTKRFLKYLELFDRLDLELYSANSLARSFINGREDLNMNVTNDLKGDTGVEKMRNFIRENDFLSSIPEIRAAIPLGVIIARLSQFEISNYDKRMLGFAQRRITDKNSLKKFFNEIEEKIVMHDMGSQSMVTDFSENMPRVFSKEDFSSDDFILGLFTGYSLAPKFINE